MPQSAHPRLNNEQISFIVKMLNDSLHTTVQNADTDMKGWSLIIKNIYILTIKIRMLFKLYN